jgi:phosphodiesterase/alkaline phosphatase D-like protein
MESTFSTLPLAILVRSRAATEITAISASLNGDLESLGTDSTVEVSFEYGTTPEFGHTTTAKVMDTTGAFSADISELLPGTIYYFRARATGSQSVHDDAITFSTAQEPVVNLSQASNITTNGATLNGKLVSTGKATSVTVRFEYGTTPDYGHQTTTQEMTSAGVFSVNVTDLEPGTTYHFRAVAVGEGTAYSPDATFSTLTVNMPPGGGGGEAEAEAPIIKSN